jgi:hypothetical protein
MIFTAIGEYRVTYVLHASARPAGVFSRLLRIEMNKIRAGDGKLCRT